MNRTDFHDLLAAARPADLDALRLDLGYSEGGRRPALLLRGSRWGKLDRVTICTAPVRPGTTTNAAFLRLDSRADDEFGPWLRAWVGKERNRRARVAVAVADAAAVRGNG